MIKIKRILVVTSIFILMLSLTNCYYDEVIEIEDIPANTAISFSNDIQPIFNTNCVSCHPSVSDPDLTEGNSYTFLTVTDPDMVVPNDADGSELYQRLLGIGGGIMPPSGALSDADISLVKNWINQGALNN